MQLFDFFSGIGGFSLAAEWMGWEVRSHCEIDPFCQQVLKKHWPDVFLHDNIKTYTNETYEMARGNSTGPTIFAGGFPCQPFSTAGKRKGTADDRDLWPDYFNTIQKNKPTYVVGENVAGLVSMDDGKVLDRIYTDLESEGYQVESFLIPACSVEAWHRRERVWIVAYAKSHSDRGGLRSGNEEEGQEQRPKDEHQDKSKRFESTGEILSSDAADTRRGETSKWINTEYGAEAIGRVSSTSKRNESNPPCTNSNGIGSYRPQIEQQGEAELRDEQICESKGLGEDVSDTRLQRQEKHEKQAARIEQCGEEDRNREDVPDTSGIRIKARISGQKQGQERESGIVDNGNSKRKGKNFWGTEPGLGDLANGVSPWLVEPNIPRISQGVKDRGNKLKGLGNSIVPQVAFEIFKAIQIHHEKNNK